MIKSKFPTSIRLTEETKEYIEKKAQLNHRSISNEIIILIEKEMKKDSK